MVAYLRSGGHSLSVYLAVPLKTMPRFTAPDAIPEEQIQRIQPIVDELLSTLHGLLDRLPPNTDSALVFELDREERG